MLGLASVQPNPQTALMLTDEELQRRKPLWTALSELWLDTEIDTVDIQRIVQVVAGSSYSVAKLNEIYLYEVAPVVGANLLIPAGAWQGFDEEWLHTEARKRAESRSLWLRFWVWSDFGRKLMTYATEEHWQKIIAQVQTGNTSAT
ncbi:hypothetical protein MGMO_124c00260 [Methyloglobulus morosus KoM1]|uniref:DUF7079 domain-containing protein n=1 Tax=Methyloglobulus morosus KoM1 TaxID=1116472 RepID=V5BAI6_9GAMM|nr:hypothetical protein [Methyloglobulus morosus]ESS70295.1 hypothetical protein MGMO_124c00260 [Methyloglobulus morosus KoM1]